MPAKTRNASAPSIGAQFFFCGPPRARREPDSSSFSLTRLAAEDAAVRTLSLDPARAGGAVGFGAGAGFAAAGLLAGLFNGTGAAAGFGVGTLGVLGVAETDGFGAAGFAGAGTAGT